MQTPYKNPTRARHFVKSKLMQANLANQRPCLHPTKLAPPEKFKHMLIQAMNKNRLKPDSESKDLKPMVKSMKQVLQAIKVTLKKKKIVH
jgi:hypothetical protein